MRNHRVFNGVMACSALFAAWLGGCSSRSDADVAAVLAGQTVDAGAGEAKTADGGACRSGLPSDIAQLLAARCQSCHASHPSAPMPLVTYDDLQAPSRSDATKKVYELALERMSASAKSMPPTGKLGQDEIDVFSAWVGAGAPKTECASNDGAGAECTKASDCPGVLVCRQGVCDVECVNDKDCTPTWTCEETRCHPPIAPTATPTYNAVTSADAWSTTIVAAAAGQSYGGTVFDGRYVYFAPQSTGVAMRYDTTVGFKSPRAWSTFDLTTLAPTAHGYRGAVFDGRYVYLVPSGSNGNLARFDSQGLYTDSAAWTFFDLTSVSSTVGFDGASFDGRYVYLVPANTGPSLRYDTAAAVNDAASWSTFRISSVNAAAVSFVGAVSTGRYVYYVPNGGAAGPRGVIARYDAEAPFGDSASWTTLDLATIDARATGYRTGAFDGRYLYLVPGWTAPSPSWATHTIARYDTQAAFPTGASWTFFDTSEVVSGAVGFNAASFDGRHLILAPGYDGSTYHGITLSYDTTADMKLATSWSAFDMTSLNAAAKSPRGTAFDGRYVYYAPVSGLAARFDARPFSAGAGQSSLGGSFY